MNRQYIGARYVPKMANPIEWSNTGVYNEALIIVTYLNNSYTSRKPVPVGTPPTNNEYWALTGNYNAQVEQYRQEVEEVKQEGQELRSQLPLNVKQFGAVGDGITDDTNAFQDFLNYIVENEETGFIPDGTYLITGGITYRELNFKKWGIIGESITNTILKFNFNLSKNHLDLRECNNFTLQNFTIMCPGISTQNAGIGLYFVNCNNALVKDINITNCSRGGVLAYNSNYLNFGVCDNLTFENVNIYGVENENNVYPMGWILSDCINTKVINSTIKNLKWYGFEFKNYCRNSYFINCNAYDCVTACHIGGELRPGDTIGCSNSGFLNITCYDVDTPMAGGSFENMVFEVTAYYRKGFTFKGGNKQYSIRFGNAFNSVVNCSLFGVPYGGSFINDCENILHNFKYIDTNDDFIGTLFYNVNSNNNVYRFIQHPLNVFIERATDRVNNNIVIDELTGLYVNNLNVNKRLEFNSMSPNNNKMNISAEELSISLTSENEKPIFAFNDLSKDYIRVDFDNINSQVIFRFIKDGVTSVVKLDKNGVSPIS